MTITITKVETGTFRADFKNACQERTIGCIWADQPAGGIAQGSARHYTARFQPSPDADGFTYTGTLRACKKWLTDMGSILS
jgi:hypothetical protein